MTLPMSDLVDPSLGGDVDAATPADAEDGADSAAPSGKSAVNSRRERRAQRRSERNQVRQAHERAHTRELSALVNVLQALPAAVPALAASPPNTGAAPLGEGRLGAGSAPLDAEVSPPQRGDERTGGPDGDEGIVGVDPSPASCGLPEPPPGPPRGTGAGPPVGGPRRRWVLQDATEVEAQLQDAEAVLRTACPYRSLPQAIGPAAAVGLLGSMVDRPPKYQEKYLGQELSLIAKVWALAGGGADAEGGGQGCCGTAIVDIGAGNGSLALLAALVLGGSAVLVDHTLPPDELRVELKVPEPLRGRILRINGDIADLDPRRDLLPLLRRHGVSRAVVVAKHLCGVGTDHALRFVERWVRDAQELPVREAEDTHDTAAEAKLVGAVFATCCGHKIGAADRGTYAELHGDDEYLAGLTGGDPERLGALLAACTRCVAWRTTAKGADSRTTALQVRAAELFEDVLQQPRLNRLRSLFQVAEEVAFVPQESSPQNRCLVGGVAERVRRAVAPDEGALLAAIGAARAELCAAGGCPLDLKPRGFVSQKYEYDGT
mmetsp:Transcript_112849/g.319195  ORF Transcript_112849/g.319195 Transcript_112849/m.319195 type:complete len:548 (+) Transcript_112849:83-1726(+)